MFVQIAGCIEEETVSLNQGSGKGERKNGREHVG